MPLAVTADTARLDCLAELLDLRNIETPDPEVEHFPDFVKDCRDAFGRREVRTESLQHFA